MKRILPVLFVMTLLAVCSGAEGAPQSLSERLSNLIAAKIGRTGVFVDQQGNVAKDPFVLEVGDNDFIVLWGDIAARRLVARRYTRRSIKPLRIEPVSDNINISIDVPGEAPQAVRWAPSMAVNGRKLYVYYTKGLVYGSPRAGAENPWGIAWDTFRIYVADTDLPADVSELGKSIRELKFGRERLLMPTPNFSSASPDFGGSPHFGVIDQEIVREGKDFFCYYVVVTQGIEGVRPHEEFIRVQKMLTCDSTDGVDRPVYDGRAGFFGDRGVAEAPNVFLYKGLWFLVYSSKPSDIDQQIMVLTAKNPWFTKKSRSMVMLSPGREGFDSIGGQALVRLKNNGQTQHYVLYQGFKKGKDGWPFYLAPIDDFIKVVAFFSAK